jgi:proline racemase
MAGGPDLRGGTVASQAAAFRAEHDLFRSAVVCEPRGSDVLVGAILCPAQDPSCAAGVIFFNNVGVLGMCGHGTIGLIATLAHLGRIAPGEHRIETPVGVVSATLHDDGEVSVENVPSYRAAANVPVVLSFGRGITGDVAWGGNWFYLTQIAPDEWGSVSDLLALSTEIRAAVNAQGHPEVDHIELVSANCGEGANARNFVLCPGLAYDRSPCGTGTSAKLACLAADGKLAESEEWVQESITGSRFRGRYRWVDQEKGTIAPVISGQAFITGEATLILDRTDPFCWGIR